MRRRAWEALFFSGISQIRASVVSIRDAIEEAFWSAVRATLVGSMTPAFTRSSYSPVSALKPKFGLAVGPHLLDDHGALEARVLRDLPQRLFAGAPDDVDADLLVARQLQGVQGLGAPQQGHAAARNDAFLDRRASGVQSILHPSLLLLHLGLGGRADLDHRHAAGQLRQPLLQLLAVVVGGGFFDLGAQLLDAAFDRLLARRRPR